MARRSEQNKARRAAYQQDEWYEQSASSYQDNYEQNTQQTGYRASYQPDPFYDNAAWQEQPQRNTYQLRNFQQDPLGDDGYSKYPDMNQCTAHPNRYFYPENEPRQPAPNVQRSRKKKAPWGIVSLISFLILALLLFLIADAYTAYATFREKAESLKAETYIDGVTVDGLSIGGLSRAQAEQALLSSESYQGQQLSITVKVDGTSYLLDASSVPFERNTQAVLDEAWALGRQNTVQTLGSSVTPMEWRYQVRQYTASQKAHFYTQVTYDKTDVRTFVDSLASVVNVEAADAMVATFDFSSRQFTFTDEVVGKKLDTDALYDALIAQLDQKNFTATVQQNTESVMPSMTRVELMNTFTKISSYTTETTADYNRNTNVQLAAQAVNGTVLSAGETFSFNSTTGQRTTAKGYLPAAAIAGGTTTEEVGGGVCQVSSTLFNAAMMANMTLVSRSPHTWPSTYVDPGRDATVNWPNLDFKFKNDGDSPIFIVCYFTQGKSMSSRGKLTVEIYGVTLGAGESIELETKLISREDPPDEPIYQRNTDLEPGTEQVLKKARTGYVYETYRVYLRNGTEYKRDLLCTSTYKMIQQVIEYN